jgi:hypothetical protein
MPIDAHVFISYVHEDIALVRSLKAALEKSGVEVWMDKSNLAPGVRWQDAITNAIRTGRFFLACFSPRSVARERSGMNEELLVAIEELRSRPQDRTWFVPLRLEKCDIPALPIGGAATLPSIEYLDMFPDWDRAVLQVLKTLWRESSVRGGDRIQPTRSDGMSIRIGKLRATDLGFRSNPEKESRMSVEIAEADTVRTLFEHGGKEG